MSRLLLQVVCLLTLSVVFSLPQQATAQGFSFGRDQLAVQSVTAGVYLVDFQFNGNAEPTFLFNFNEPAYGLVFTRHNLMATFAFGTQQANENQESLQLLDASLAAWGQLRLLSLGSDDRTRLFLPIMFYSHYRRVAPRGNDDALVDAFRVTVLGLGTGLGLVHPVSNRALFEARATPVFGLATTSVADALGTSYLIDVDAQVHLVELFGKMGLSLGYNFRSQVWNVNASDLFPDVTDELFDYRGHHHLFRLGLNW